MATLTVTPVTRSGVDLSAGALAAATSGGDAFPSTGQEFFVVNNGDSGSHTVQFLLQRKVDGASSTAVTHTVGAGVTKQFGPFPTADYADAGGLVQVRYDAVTSVVVGVVKCPPAGPGQ